MRTSQLYIQDNNQAVTMLYSFRFESSKQIAGKRPPPLKQTLVNPTLKNPKHATVLSENNINYDHPLNPMSVAEIRAQRIQREKKQSQAAAVSSTFTSLFGRKYFGFLSSFEKIVYYIHCPSKICQHLHVGYNLMKTIYYLCI